MNNCWRWLGAFMLACVCVVTSAAAQAYHVTHTYPLRTEGGPGWDLMALDTVHHRLFVTHQDRVLVIDPRDGRVVGQVLGLNRAHGVAFAYGVNRGFASSGSDSSVVMFDLSTLRVISRITAAQDADAMLFEPVSGRIISFNGHSSSATVIDPQSGKAVATVSLPGAPESAVAGDSGAVYVNLEDQGAMAELDGRTWQVRRQWSLAPCTSPTGLAIDRVHKRLFSGCRSGVMAISDLAAGRVIATLPIGAGVDACRFDPALSLAFASNGGAGAQGTITVVHEDAPDSFHVVENVPTKPGARTMELDAAAHRLYTVTAELAPGPAPTEAQPHPRPSVVPGTFMLLVIER